MAHRSYHYSGRYTSGKTFSCPYCSKTWVIGRKGGGLVKAGALKHIKVCEEKHGKEVDVKC